MPRKHYQIKYVLLYYLKHFKDIIFLMILCSYCKHI